MHILGIDLETTGIDENECSITEAAMVYYDDRERKKELFIKVKPRDKSRIMLYAMKMTHKDIYSLWDSESLTQEEACIKIISFLVNEVFPLSGNNKLTILGHNVMFDVTRLNKLLNLHNIHGWEEVFNIKLLDTASYGELFREAALIKPKNTSLHNLAKELNIEYDENQLHNALYDVDLTFKVYFAMLDKLKGLNNGKEIAR